MRTDEITGAVINSDCVTNDPAKIDAALVSGQQVEYVSRARARRLACGTKRTQWSVLAEAPAVFLVIDGVRYGRSGIESPISFPVRASSVSLLPIIAG